MGFQGEGGKHFPFARELATRTAPHSLSLAPSPCALLFDSSTAPRVSTPIMNASVTARAGASAPSASGAGAKSSPSPSLRKHRRAAAASASLASDSGASSSSSASSAAGSSPPRMKTVLSVSPHQQHHSSSRARSHQVGTPPPLGAASDIINSSLSATAAATAAATTARTSATPSTKKPASSLTRDWDSSWASADEPWANGEVIYVNEAELEQGSGGAEAALGGEFRAFGLGADDDQGDDDEGGQTKTRKKRLPAEMRCFDTARIYVKGGDGGKGCVAFRREKFVPKGGPSGGNGGDGGHVYAVADASLTSLAVFRRQLHFRAPGGDHGGGSKCHGANANDIEVRVPPGTIFRKRKALDGDPAHDGGSAGGGANGDEFDDELDPPIAELVSPGERALLAVGGKGGRGNASFKTHKNNAPTMAELGEPGEEWWLDVELRLVADVGIVGVPNAGKSSLLSALSAAKPKVANYPFTTLVPQLGVCELDYRSTVFADVPGLLEGAHAGVGLGHEFLRHVSRCRAAVHVVDGSSRDPVGDYAAVRAELELFSPELAALPQVVAYNKVDLPDSADYLEDVRSHLAEAHGVHPDDVIAVSAATGTGVPELVRRVRALLDELAEEEWAKWEEEERSRRKRERAEALGAGGNGNAVVGGVSGGFRLGDSSSAFDDDDDADDAVTAGASGTSFDPLLAAPPPGRDDFFPGQTSSGFGSPSSTALARNGRAPGSLPPRRATNALNLQEPVRSKNPLSSAAARGGKIGDYNVAAGRDGGGGRFYKVSGAGIDRFVAMTNWNYYESALRFQKVLEASGIVDELKAQGVKPGDTVSVGGNEFLWSDDRSDGALYEAWMTDRRASGRVLQGSHAWPHAGG